MGGEGRRASTLPKAVNKRLQWPAEHRPSSVQVVGMELHLSPFYDDLVHVARFGRENFSVLELDVMIWDWILACPLPKFLVVWPGYASVAVSLHLDKTGLSKVDPGQTDRRYCVYLASSVDVHCRTDEAGDLGGSGPTSLLICWDKMLMMLSVVWTYGEKVINIGLVLGFMVLESGLNTHCICFHLCPLFLKRNPSS